MSPAPPDYREVPERIAEWYDRHPEGRIVCKVLEWEQDRVMVRASAYRTSEPTEPPAGVGHSFLAIPGATNFTRGSELENAETSAAGRALVMAGIPAKSVASGQEVASKRGESGGESVAYGEGATGNNAPGSSRTCPHKYWSDMPNKPGWMVCDTCGLEGPSS